MDGSILTEAYVASGQKVSGTRDVTRETVVLADQYDFSTGELIAFSSGFLDTLALRISRNLAGASRVTDVPVQEGILPRCPSI
ncbi:MAG: hypothetical protein IRY97_03885 [Thermomicrobiaceae bacterium]|nr:hypothetical protein [Thermomicrobiaceae bacterium]